MSAGSWGRVGGQGRAARGVWPGCGHFLAAPTVPARPGPGCRGSCVGACQGLALPLCPPAGPLEAASRLGWAQGSPHPRPPVRRPCAPRPSPPSSSPWPVSSRLRHRPRPQVPHAGQGRRAGEEGTWVREAGAPGEPGVKDGMGPPSSAAPVFPSPPQSGQHSGTEQPPRPPSLAPAAPPTGLWDSPPQPPDGRGQGRPGVGVGRSP